MWRPDDPELYGVCRKVGVACINLAKQPPGAPPSDMASDMAITMGHEHEHAVHSDHDADFCNGSEQRYAAMLEAQLAKQRPNHDVVGIVGIYEGERSREELRAQARPPELDYSQDRLHRQPLRRARRLHAWTATPTGCGTWLVSQGGTLGGISSASLRAAVGPGEGREPASRRSWSRREITARVRRGQFACRPRQPLRRFAAQHALFSYSSRSLCSKYAPLQQPNTDRRNGARRVYPRAGGSTPVATWVILTVQ